MAKERKALEKLLPGRKGARLTGFILLFLALELAVMCWFAGAYLAPHPALLDEQSADGDYVYLTVADSDGIFAEDSSEMGYYFLLDRDGFVSVARMDAATHALTLEKLRSGQTVTLTGLARRTPDPLRELVIRSWGFLDDTNYYDYFTPCLLDCTERPGFLPATLCGWSAGACLLLAALCFVIWLSNRTGRRRCLHRLEELELCGAALAQLTSPEGRTGYAPDILVTRDFLAVGATGRICALGDVQRIEMGRRLVLVLRDGGRMPLQHGLLPRLDTRLLEHLSSLLRKE